LEIGRRFTPTGVGTIPPRRATRNCSPVHPHGRGDNFRINSPTKSVGGSPPRAWGQYSDETARCVEKRFTPTGVGTMRTLEVRGDINAVHPHGRGDNRLTGQTLDRLGGSPPRAWGQSRRSAEARRRQRFTPTGVGTMRVSLKLEFHSSVHPHGRGDNLLSLSDAQKRVGSPPRAWGQSHPRRCAGRAGRFTPTGVGTIRSPPGSAGCTMVHPHGRGDNRARARSRAPSLGSPPRAWGQWRG